MKRKIISTDPQVMGGTPCFARTRVPLQTLLDYLETGDSIDEFLERLSHREAGASDRLPRNCRTRLCILCRVRYSEDMNTLAEIEGAILKLPQDQLSILREWINERTEARRGDAEDPALEAALLAALESPRLSMEDGFFSEVRQLLARHRSIHAA